jgi:hypothetical protein
MPVGGSASPEFMDVKGITLCGSEQPSHRFPVAFLFVLAEGVIDIRQLKWKKLVLARSRWSAKHNNDALPQERRYP